MFKDILKNKYVTTVLLAVIFVLVASTTVYAATTIGTNIQTGGTLSVTSTSTFSATTTVSGIVFGNGWSLASTTATTTEITVSDSAGNPVLIFDAN